MSIVFNPTPRSTVKLPIPVDEDGRFRFTASFPSRADYVRARSEGVRVEMWTNLPVGTIVNRWHALAFNYIEDIATSSSAAETRPDSAPPVLHLPRPDAPESADANLSVFLDVEVPHQHVGSTFSFTYRLVRSSNNVRWLGRYREDGHFIVEEGDPRFASVSGNPRIERAGSRLAQSHVQARLSGEYDWDLWEFDDQSGICSSSTSLVLSDAKAALLIPRRRPGTHAITTPRPLFALSTPASNETRILASGDIEAHAPPFRMFSVYDADALQKLFQEHLTLHAVVKSDDDTAVIASSTHESMSPILITVISLKHDMRQSQYADVHLSYEDLGPTVRCWDGFDVMAFETRRSTLVKIPPGVEEIVLHGDLPGVQYVFTHFQTLPAPDSHDRWSFALVSNSSATIEHGPSHPPPTPPPSPPPTFSDPSAQSQFTIPTITPSTPEPSPAERTEDNQRHAEPALLKTTSDVPIGKGGSAPAVIHLFQQLIHNGWLQFVAMLLFHLAGRMHGVLNNDARRSKQSRLSLQGEGSSEAITRQREQVVFDAQKRPDVVEIPDDLDDTEASNAEVGSVPEPVSTMPASSSLPFPTSKPTSLAPKTRLTLKVQHGLVRFLARAPPNADVADLLISFNGDKIYDTDLRLTSTKLPDNTLLFTFQSMQEDHGALIVTAGQNEARTS